MAILRFGRRFALFLATAVSCRLPIVTCDEKIEDLRPAPLDGIELLEGDAISYSGRTFASCAELCLFLRNDGNGTPEGTQTVTECVRPSLQTDKSWSFACTLHTVECKKAPEIVGLPRSCDESP